MAQKRYRILQPWGRDKTREATLISEHATAAEAFAEIDRLSAQMVCTGAPSDAAELIVVDEAGAVVTCWGALNHPDRGETLGRCACTGWSSCSTLCSQRRLQRRTHL